MNGCCCCVCRRGLFALVQKWLSAHHDVRVLVLQQRQQLLVRSRIQPRALCGQGWAHAWAMLVRLSGGGGRDAQGAFYAFVVGGLGANELARRPRASAGAHTHTHTRAVTDQPTRLYCQDGRAPTSQDAVEAAA